MFSHYKKAFSHYKAFHERERLVDTHDTHTHKANNATTPYKRKWQRQEDIDLLSRRGEESECVGVWVCERVKVWCVLLKNSY